MDERPGDGAGRASPPRGGLPGRHWRGEYPLWRSFWLHGVLLSFLISVLFAYLPDWLESWITPRLHALWTVLAPPLVFGILGWQATGIWRAAGRSSVNNTVLARVTVAWMVLIQGYNVWLLRPVLYDAAQVAFELVPATPVYRISLSDDGSAILVNGRIGAGMTRDVAGLYNRHKGVRRIVLNSPGGLVKEAQRLRIFIRLHQLETHTTVICYSACPLAFLGGRERTLHPTARLGFHQFYVPHLGAGVVARDVDREKAYMKRQGIAPEFVEQALQTPYQDMWTPPAARLQAAGFIKRVTAWPGLDPAQDGSLRQLITLILAQDPVAATIYRHDGVGVGRIVEQAGRAHQNGTELMQAVADATVQELRNLLARHLPTATNQAAFSALALDAEIYAHAAKAANGWCTKTALQTAARHPEVTKRLTSMALEVMKSSRTSPQPPPAAGEVDALIRQVRQRVRDRVGNVGGAAANSCTAEAAVLQEMQALGAEDGGRLYRHLASRQAGG